MQGFVSTNPTKVSLTDSTLKSVRQSHFSTTPLMRMNATTIASAKPNMGDLKRSIKPVHAASLGRPAQPKMQFQSFKSDHGLQAMDLNDSM